QRIHALRAADCRCRHADVLHLCLREHGHGEWTAAGGGRAAAAGVVRRNGAGVAVHRARHPNERAVAPQAHEHLSVSMRQTARGLALAALAMLVVACSTTRAPRDTAPSTTGKPGYYKDDGPADAVPSDLEALPDATPRREPLHR